MLSRHCVNRISGVLGRRWYAAAAAQSSGKPATSPDELRLTFASPYEVFFNSAVVKQVDVTTLSGSVGILPKHVPVLGMLKPGIVRIIDGNDKIFKYFASSGTLSMNPDGSCQVLAEEAISLKDIDLEKAQEELRSAQRRVLESKEDAERAAIQIEIETYEALVKAAQETDK